jgi:hypothetical protein
MVLSAAIVHCIPFVYVQQALSDRRIDDALQRFLDDFDPRKVASTTTASGHINPIQQRLVQGYPVLTMFERQLLLQHLFHSISTEQCRQLEELERCLLAYVQQMTVINFSRNTQISHLNRAWLKSFLFWAQSCKPSLDLSWLNIEQL